MKKSTIFIWIGIIAIIALLFAIILIQKDEQKTDIATDINNQTSNQEQKPLKRIVKVEGKLYYDTGKVSTMLRCGVMDGQISSNVENTKVPTEDNQSNFEGNYNYQYGLENSIEVLINEQWIIFEAEEKTAEKEFEIKVYDKSQEGVPRDRIILASGEGRKYDYSIHGYNISVNIIIDKEEISLKNALLEDKITMDEILAKAEKESKNTQIYKDGGSKSYNLENYTIIKLNRIEDNKDINIPTGPKDVYFGMPGFNINEIGK